MKDRKMLQDELNRINELYQQKDLEMRKVGADTVQRQKMRDMMNAKKEQVMAEMGDDLQKLNAGGSISVKGASAPAESAFGNLSKKLGKKALGVLPFAGAGMAALSGEPAMAAEELAQDAMGPAGLAYEAIRPSDSGNPEEERQMLAERNALEDYKNSPAAAARKAALQSLK